MTQFICSSFVYFICQEISVLNKEIHKIYTSRDVIPIEELSDHLLANWKKKNVNFNDLLILDKIDLSWSVYTKISDCCIVLNDYFSLAIYAVLAVSSLGILFSGFIIMNIFIDITYGKPMLWSNLIISIAEVLMNAINITTIIQVCNRCEQEV